MSNYPPGAEHDPNAPWNDERKFTEWERYDNMQSVCPECKELAYVNEDGVCEECFKPEVIE